MTVAIDHLDCHYAVPKNGEGSAAVRARLDRVAATDLVNALRRRAEPLPEHDGAICFIERLEIETFLGADATEPGIAERWAEALWSALAKRLRDGDGIVRFAGRAELLASFVIDLLAGDDQQHWYYAELHELAGSTADRALHVLRADPDTGREALTEIHRRGYLHALLQLLGEPRLEELVTRCLLPPSGEAGFGATLKRWTEAVLGVRASARFAPSGRPAYDAIVLYLETLAARPELGPDVNLARWIVRLLAVAAACERTPILAAAIRNGDFDAARPLLESPEQVRFAGSMLQAVSPREVAALLAEVRPARTGDTLRMLHTAHAGVFLLASSVEALDDRSDRSYKTYSTYRTYKTYEAYDPLPPAALFQAAVHALGADDATTRDDAGIAVFAGFDAPPSPDLLAEQLSQWLDEGVDTDRVLEALGSTLLRHFASRLGAFADSSPEYLRRNFLGGRGVVTVSDTRVTVRFVDCPMRIVLRMAGHDAAVRMPWNRGRVLELQLE